MPLISPKTMDRLCVITPLGVIFLLWITYWLSPEFFLAYVLEERNREYGAVEIITVLVAFLSGMLLVYVAWGLWKRNWKWASGVVGVVALATVFFAGEEISWGQSFFHWSTPAWWDQHVAYETNIHNSQISVVGFHHLAGLFQLSVFVLLPLVWAFRTNLGLTLPLGPSVPEIPVTFCILIAFVYREGKNLYGSWFPPDHVFHGLIWGVNEHREMLVAIGLFFYAIYRVQMLHKIDQGLVCR